MKRSFVDELLKDLDIDEAKKKEIIDKIISENGNDINAEKAKTESAKNDLKVKESLIDELNTKIKNAGEVDIEAIKKQAREEGLAEGSKEVDEFRKTNALKASIQGAKDFDLVCSKLDKNKIKYEKNDKGEYVVSGVDEQLKDIKEKYSYLFDEKGVDTQEDSISVNSGGTHKNLSDTDSLKMLESAMGIETEENKK